MASDDLTLGDILGDATTAAGMFEILPEPTLQEQVAASIVPGAYGVEHPARIVIETTDPLDVVSAWAFERANRVVGPMPVWLRFRRADRANGLLAVIHSPAVPAEADLVLVADRPGMLTRSTLRAIAGWAFGSCGLSRIVLRIPAGDDRLKDLARRAGCHHEGTARYFFGEGADASVWSMLARECPWLGPRPAPAIPVPDTSPPSSARTH